MNIRSVTLAQALVLVACVLGTFAAYRFLGPNAAAASAMASYVLTFMLGRPPADPPAAAPGGVQ